MKAIFAVFVALMVSATAQETFVVVNSLSFVRTVDGVPLSIKPGDCVPFAEKSDSGAWISFTVAGLRGSVPWHDAKIVGASPAVRADYLKVVARIKRDYLAEMTKREKVREVARERAQLRAEQEAEAREDRLRLRFLSELQQIREQMEILNRRR